MKKKVLKILILSILFLLIYYKNSYGFMQIIPNDSNNPVWKNITVSQSYDECIKLNSSSSTIGTDSLRAHLSTDADWSAMAIFSVSQYGNQTSNLPTWTNNNASGIGGIDIHNLFQTTGLLEIATKDSPNIGSLFNQDGTVKKYVKKWDVDRTDNDFVAFKDTANNGTFGWMESRTVFCNGWYDKKDYPCSIKYGLFGVIIGDCDGNYGVIAKGAGHVNTTFRPVIWN